MELRIWGLPTMMYNTQNRWVWSFLPSPGILNNRKKTFRKLDLFPPWGEGRETSTLLGLLERANHSHWTWVEGDTLLDPLEKLTTVTGPEWRETLCWILYKDLPTVTGPEWRERHSVWSLIKIYPQSLDLSGGRHSVGSLRKVNHCHWTWVERDTLLDPLERPIHSHWTWVEGDTLLDPLERPIHSHWTRVEGDTLLDPLERATHYHCTCVEGDT
jgi:hypothetical protein